MRRSLVVLLLLLAALLFQLLDFLIERIEDGLLHVLRPLACLIER